MTWLIWRQHRVQVALAFALVAAFAVAAAITGSRLDHLLASCRADGTCGTFDILHGYSAMRAIVNLTIAVPPIIGAFWGATIVGRELETGTATLAWSQSVTRRRWLTTKLSTLFLLTAACSGAVAAVVSWWSNTVNATTRGRFDGVQFDIQGIVPVGYALFAAALGLAAGVLWRRVLPAMATTVGAFVGVRLVVELFLRPRYMSPVIRTTGLGVGADVPSGSFVTGTDLIRHGRVIAGPVAPDPSCQGATSRDAMSRCMEALGYRLRTTYQPASRYWTFQWIEFGIFVGLTLLLVAVALLVLRRRDA